MSNDTPTPDREMPMIERIARALALLQYPADEHDRPALRWIADEGKYGRMVETTTKVWEDFIPAANAAIAAMGEPTQGMMRAVEFGDAEKDVGPMIGAARDGK